MQTKQDKYLPALGMQWTATIYIAAVSFLLTFYVGRMLGPELFGRYSYILTATAIFAIFIDGGYKIIIYREQTSPSPELKKLVPGLTALAQGNTLIFTMFGIILVIFLPIPYKKSFSAALLCFGLIALTNIVSSNLKAKGEFKKEGLWQILIRTLGAAGVFVLLFYAKATPFHVFTGWAIGVASGLVLILRHMPLPRFTGLIEPDLRKACFALMAIEAATIIYFRIDIILLKHLGENSAQVGEYSAAYRFIEGFVLIFTPVSMILFRKFRLFWQNTALFKKTVLKMSFMMVAFATLITLTGIIFGKEIINLTYGPEYKQAAALLPWLLLSLFFILPNGILTQAAIAVNSEIFYAKTAALCAAVNLVLNIILIPGFGAFGAAWATIVTEAVLLLSLISCLKLIKK